MQIIFRADASIQIGTGHVMRCLTLANALASQGHQCHFICREHQGHLGDLISSQGHGLTLLPKPQQLAAPAAQQLNSNTNLDYSSWLGVPWATDATQTQQAIAALKLQPDWLVVDHYALDARWEQKLADTAKKILVIDDLANRPHQCNLLLDQNVLDPSIQKKYTHLVNKECQLLLGPQYALLRPEFFVQRNHSLERRKNFNLEKVLITFGGVDQYNMTGQVLDWIKNLPFLKNTLFTVILGSNSPWQKEVKAQLVRLPWKTKLLINVKQMAEVLSEQDLCIGAAGGTTWERATLGLPGLITPIAANQQLTANSLNNLKMAWLFDRNNPDAFNCHLIELIQDKTGSKLKEQSENLSHLCQGKGTDKVVAFL